VDFLRLRLLSAVINLALAERPLQPNGEQSGGMVKGIFVRINFGGMGKGIFVRINFGGMLIGTFVRINFGGMVKGTLVRIKFGVMGKGTFVRIKNGGMGKGTLCSNQICLHGKGDFFVRIAFLLRLYI
jgi:hypothetical protein